MYEDAQRWGYLFQSYVLLTMMELHHKPVVSLVHGGSCSLYTYLLHTASVFLHYQTRVGRREHHL